VKKLRHTASGDTQDTCENRENAEKVTKPEGRKISKILGVNKG
jgi:hypothetical protein